MWTWASGTPEERGAMVRQHRWIVSRDCLLQLFLLTPAGLDAILAGNPWRREYSTDSTEPE